MKLTRLTGAPLCLAIALVTSLGLVPGVAQAAIIGVDIDVSNGAPSNWTAYTLAQAGTTVTNLVAEDGSITGVNFQLIGQYSSIQAFSVPSNLIPSHTTPLDLVAGDLVFGGPNPAVAQWSGLAPGATYNYWVFVSSSADDTITATGGTIDSFFSPNVSHVSQRINGVLGDSQLTFASYARQVVASQTGTIQIDILSNGTPTPSGYAIELASGAAIPEPSTLVLLGAGLGLLALRRRFIASNKAGFESGH